jgi:hypothetical protein
MKESTKEFSKGRGMIERRRKIIIRNQGKKNT